MSMVEKVARALCNIEVGEGGCDAIMADGSAQWQAYIPDVITVLKAMRKPTPAMVDAGAQLCDAAYSGKAVHAAWQAMIDAALDGEG
ncbi:hypothetical protein K7W03_18870 [Sphingobium sp. PNB]|uniref:hypothetical protein n=1 Tax=Sphingobium sp. PNB TaxID=863934 RepID=UPI001CA3C8B4|nr:hypothetical protein [Sphingobium sp. PNB]MCB4861656.1 hypothetical protein [Sphingobium sp. PNB]